MAELSPKGVVAVAALAGALVGGAVAGGVTLASGNNSGSDASSSTGSGTSLSTARVVRTTLSTSVQVGGSIGYDGSYTVAAPSGTSSSQLAQARQAVTADEQTISADQRAEADTRRADNQAIRAAKTELRMVISTLRADRTRKSKDCGGAGASSQACSQDKQNVTQDRAQRVQDEQQLAAAKTTALRDHDQSASTLASDRIRLHADRATVASLLADAVNLGTTYTWLPQAGAVIRQGQRVYSLSNQPVPLLYGSIAAYRAFYLGMSDGADVGELTRGLIALGYGSGLTAGNHYSAATAAAVERWQRSLGVPATGEILLGAVVFEPGPIRVSSVTPAVGSPVGGGAGGTVLTATSTAPVVSVDLDVSEQYLVKPGDHVTVVLPNGRSTVGGRIETVGSVATCPGGGGTGLGGGSSSGQSPCEAIGSGNSSTPTVPVTISLDRAPPGARLDQAPVNVSITSQRASHVLAVPVNALLALAGGGYGVDLVNGNTARLVGVTTGLYSNSLVQVNGSGLKPGMRVEVPSS